MRLSDNSCTTLVLSVGRKQTLVARVRAPRAPLPLLSRLRGKATWGRRDCIDGPPSPASPEAAGITGPRESVDRDDWQGGGGLNGDEVKETVPGTVRPSAAAAAAAAAVLGTDDGCRRQLH